MNCKLALSAVPVSETVSRTAAFKAAIKSPRVLVPLLAAGLAAATGLPVHAAGGETFSPDATAYGGTMTDTGTFVTSMISTYAPKAILISVALGGVGLIWGWARRAVGH